MLARKELELLLCCARTDIPEAIAIRIETILASNIDWKYLIDAAAEHGLTPLLYRSLSRTCPEAVPEKVLAQLQTNYQTTVLYSLFLTQELIELLQLLSANGVHALPLKGPTLTACAYGDISLRQFRDLDILVKESDFQATKQLLISLGYRSNEFLNEGDDGLKQLLREDHLVRSDGRLMVDLHWAIAPTHFPFQPEFEQLLKRGYKVPLLGSSVESLSPEDLLVYLCVHGCKDLWERMVWITDIAELIRTKPLLDWQQILQRSQELKCDRMLFLGLLLAHQLLQTDLPEEVWQRIEKTPAIYTLATKVQNRLLASKEESEMHLWMFNFSFLLPLMETIPQKLSVSLFILRFILTPKVKDTANIKLPDSLYFLYYIIRPFRLLVKFGFAPLKQ